MIPLKNPLGGLVAIFVLFFPLILGFDHHPLTDELILFRGVAKNHQPVIKLDYLNMPKLSEVTTDMISSHF